MKIIIANSNPILSKNLRDHFNNQNFRHFVKKQELNLNAIESIKPDYIFFPHWSFIIPEEIYKNYNCIVFHMTDLPFGKGGSPLQNLISRGIYQTKISAIKVVKELDSGPIYLKKDFSLHGNAEEIFIRASKVISEMIDEIIKTQPEPIGQEGTPVTFKRRTPEMSNIETIKDIVKLFDYIRMLDAEGYPKAFFENENFRFEFSRALQKSDNSIIADVRISKK